jgi:methyl-accepting chemotaxis protein
MDMAAHLVVPEQIVSANKFVAVVLWGLFLFSILLASLHGTWTIALVIGGLTALIPTVLIAGSPGALATRLTAGAALMVFCGLNIQQAHGMTELHFGIFVLLALLTCYEDWKVIAAAAGVIAVHHLGFSYLQQAGYGVYVMPQPGYGMVLVHAAYVVVEAVALCYLAVVMASKTAKTFASRAKLQETLDSMDAVAVEVRQSVESINASSGEMAAASREMARGAQQQAASLEQTSASLEQITAAVRLSADNARQASAATRLWPTPWKR